MHRASLLAYALAAARLVSSDILTLSSQGGVNPSGFDACYNQATSVGFTCTTACNGHDLCVIACGCAMEAEQVGCQVEYCWNKAFAGNFAGDCVNDTSLIPFWPAPADAPDSCTCNLENLYDTVLQSIHEQTTCTNRVSTELTLIDPVGAINNITGCACCAASGAISAAYNMCPDIDPSHLAMDKIKSLVSIMLGGGTFESCDKTLAEFDCINDLQFPDPPDNGHYYANSALPASGTATLADTGGSLTSPPFGSVTTISVSTYTVVLTAASYDAGNVAVTTQPSSGTETQTTTAGTPTPTGGSIKAVELSWGALMCVLFALI